LKLETDKNKIVWRYVTTWFTIDILSTFPWDLLAYLVVHGEAPYAWLQVPRLFRLLRIFKIMRSLKILRLKQSITRLEVRLRLKYGYLRMGWLIMIICLIAHWGGCLFFLIGELSGPNEGSWIGQEGVPNDKYGRYLAAVYFATFTITTIGYGDIVPQNAMERSYIILLMLVGALMLAYIISQVGATVAELSAQEERYRRDMDELTEFVSNYDVPSGLAFDLRRYFQHRATYSDTDKYRHLFDMMSSDLRAKIKIYMYEDSLKESVLLQRIEKGKCDDIYVAMVTGLARPGQVLYMNGDKSEHMFAVLHGCVDIVDGQNSRRRISQGSVFGEDELLFNCYRRESATAVDYCSYATVSREAVMTALRRNRRVLRELRDREAAKLWAHVLVCAEKEIRFWMILREIKSMSRSRRGRFCVWETRLVLGDQSSPSVVEMEDARLRTSSASMVSKQSGLTSHDVTALPIRACCPVYSIQQQRDVLSDDDVSSSTLDANSFDATELRAGELSDMLLADAAVRARDTDKCMAHALTRSDLEQEFISRGQKLVALLVRVREVARLSAELHAAVGKVMSESYKR
jgi:CRP-like cAMP-binding protein